MRKYLLFCTILSFTLMALPSSGQDEDFTGYKVYNKHQRSALYTVMLEQGKRSQVKYADEIKTVFLTLATPERFDNHDIDGQKIINVGNDGQIQPLITSFLERNDVAKQLVAKWYNRHVDGSFDMELVKERGFYNADELERMRAAMTVRGEASLADEGEELIGNTFMLVNDIRYFDKEEAGQIAMAILAGIAGVAQAYASTTSNANDKSIAQAAEGVAAFGALMADVLSKGFSVKITSYLYKLDWNSENAAQFYEQLYTELPDVARRNAFDSCRGLFKLNFVGSQQVRADVQSTKFSAKTGEELIRKTLYKALDKSIVELQHQNEVFRSKTPIATVGDGVVTANIGLKEGVDTKTNYYVYERLLNEQTGDIKYRQVCSLKAVKDKIWDNTYMAASDKQHGNIDISATEFKIIGKAQPQVGMLIHEGKINNTDIKNITQANQNAKVEAQQNVENKDN
ncbi:MAG: hypothetical protein RSA50_00040 [Mucinivorans sp.]